MGKTSASVKHRSTLKGLSSIVFVNRTPTTYTECVGVHQMLSTFVILVICAVGPSMITPTSQLRSDTQALIHIKGSNRIIAINTK
jgi:hypothetical protein